MASLQRRLNSTQRIRITRDRVSIQLEEPATPAAFPTASATVSLKDFTLPGDAVVAIEAYYRNSSMRFACGTVAAIEVPNRMELTDIDRGGAVRFRLVIVEPETGRILASAEGLRPTRTGDGPEKQPLLPLLERDLGEQLWRVDIDERSGPTLLVNNRLLGLAADLRASPLVQGLILPHALGMILQELGSPGEEEGDDEWGNDWRRFLDDLGVPLEPDEYDSETGKQQWVRDAVEAFCERRRFAERAQAVLQGGSGND